MALDEKPQIRITRRHDSVLLAIHHCIKEHVEGVNTSKRPGGVEVQAFSNPLAATSFKSASGSKFCVPKQLRPVSVFGEATDWKIQFDLDMEEGISKPALLFPSEIAVVSGKGSRPDGVIWSMSSTTVIWIEITSPWEENMSKRHFEKKSKYNQLKIDLRNSKYPSGAWTVYAFEEEVGARGAINEQPWHWMCKQLDLSPDARKRLTSSVQDAAIYCSHLIYLCRFHRIWDPRPLLNTYRWAEDSQ